MQLHGDHFMRFTYNHQLAFQNHLTSIASAKLYMHSTNHKHFCRCRSYWKISSLCSLQKHFAKITPLRLHILSDKEPWSSLLCMSCLFPLKVNAAIEVHLQHDQFAYAHLQYKLWSFIKSFVPVMVSKSTILLLTYWCYLQSYETKYCRCANAKQVSHSTQHVGISCILCWP